MNRTHANEHSRETIRDEKTKRREEEKKSVAPYQSTASREHNQNRKNFCRYAAELASIYLPAVGFEIVRIGKCTTSSFG